MGLDRERGCWLGVLAGIANWLDVPVALVRVVFVICVLAWPLFIVGYFVAWLVLDRDVTPDKIRDYFSDSDTAAHFRKIDYRKSIYRNERNKRIAGVCAGIADYLEVSTFSVRLVTLLSLFIFGPFTFWAYIICWFVFEPDPLIDDQARTEKRRRRGSRREARRQRHAARRRARQVRKAHGDEEESTPLHSSNYSEPGDFADPAETGDAGNYSRSACTSEFSELETRLREIEAFMTSKRFRLHCEINRI